MRQKRKRDRRNYCRGLPAWLASLTPFAAMIATFG